MGSDGLDGVSRFDSHPLPPSFRMQTLNTIGLWKVRPRLSGSL
jgi:hypothetical protein